MNSAYEKYQVKVRNCKNDRDDGEGDGDGVKIGDVYYIPEFVSLEEEGYLLRQVSWFGKGWLIQSFACRVVQVEL